MKLLLNQHRRGLGKYADHWRAKNIKCGVIRDINPGTTCDQNSERVLMVVVVGVVMSGDYFLFPNHLFQNATIISYQNNSFKCRQHFSANTPYCKLSSCYFHTRPSLYAFTVIQTVAITLCCTKKILPGVTIALYLYHLEQIAVAASIKPNELFQTVAITS